MTGPLGPILDPVGDVVRDVVQPVLAPTEAAAGSTAGAAAAQGAIGTVEKDVAGAISSVTGAVGGSGSSLLSTIEADLSHVTGWEHVAAILAGVGAVAVGLLDMGFFHKLGTAVDSTFLTAGLAVLGIKGTGILPS
jgi:hypothetical protein